MTKAAPAAPPSPPARAPAPADAVPWGLRVTAEVAWRLLVLAGALWILLQIVGSLRLVFLSFTAALLMAALLQPTVTLLRRHGVPRALAAAITFIGGLGIMALIGWFVYWQVNENIDTLTSKVQEAISQLRDWLSTGPLHLTDKQIDEYTKQISDAVGTNSERLTSAGVAGVTVIVEVLSGVALALFTTYFLIYDGERIWQWVLRLWPGRARDAVAGAGPKAWSTLTGYIRGTVTIAFIDALFIGIGVALLGVPLAIPLAVVIFLGAFVPLVGALISGVLAVAVAMVTEGVVTALVVLAVVVGVQQIEGHLLQPLILGRAVKVHPLAVVLAVTCGSLLAGIGGAVVSVPLVAVVNTVAGHLVGYRRDQRLLEVGAAGVAAAPGEPTAPVGEPAEPEGTVTVEEPSPAGGGSEGPGSSGAPGAPPEPGPSTAKGPADPAG